MNLTISEDRILYVPSTWDKMGFCAKAGYLAVSGQATNYEAACKLLGSLGKSRKRKPAAKYSATERTENYWWNRE